MGEDACFLSSVCLSCGRFIDDAEPGHRCPHCGDPLYRADPIDKRAERLGSLVEPAPDISSDDRPGTSSPSPVTDNG